MTLAALAEKSTGVGASRYAPGMARPRRIYKLKWRSKKANHGRKPTRGRNKKWR